MPDNLRLYDFYFQSHAFIVLKYKSLHLVLFCLRIFSDVGVVNWLDSSLFIFNHFNFVSLLLYLFLCIFLFMASDPDPPYGGNINFPCKKNSLK